MDTFFIQGGPRLNRVSNDTGGRTSDEEMARLHGKVGEGVMDKELFEEKVQWLETKALLSGAASDTGLVIEIREVITAAPVHGEGYREVWTRLRCHGIRTLSLRIRRLVRRITSRG